MYTVGTFLPHEPYNTKVPCPTVFPPQARMNQEFDSLLDSMATDDYTVRQLREAFAMVQNPDNWKGPINASIDPHFRSIVDAAVPFVTGSSAHFSEVKDDGKLWVHAEGYREAVGA